MSGDVGGEWVIDVITGTTSNSTLNINPVITTIHKDITCTDGNHSNGLIN